MRTDLFDFDLPDDRIALNPASPRDAARLLVVTSHRLRRASPNSPLPPCGERVGGRGGSPGHPKSCSFPPPLALSPQAGRGEAGAGSGERASALQDRLVSDLPDLFRPGDALVFNDTRVIRAALQGERLRGKNRAVISFNLHKRVDEHRWLAFARPAKRLAAGDRIRFGHDGRVCLLGTLDATVARVGEAGEVELAFTLTAPISTRRSRPLGDPPLPPYIAGRRAVEPWDAERYQTVYARREGAVAAPTAGLHFTDRLLAALDARGISRHFVTLHVGAGTFLPVKSRGHERASHARRVGRDHAQRPPRPSTRRAAPAAASSPSAPRRCACWRRRRPPTAASAPFAGETDLFITPGYRFKAVDLLLTNFHLPRSTLFMLVAAFSGLDTMQRAYAHAIAAAIASIPTAMPACSIRREARA